MNEELIKEQKELFIFRNLEFAKDLRGNTKKKRHDMRCGDARCCLAVAEDTALRLGIQDYVVDPQGITPHPALFLFFGWPTMASAGLPGFSDDTWERTPAFRMPNGSLCAATIANDGSANTVYSWAVPLQYRRSGLPHELIAECVEKTFCGNTEPWTFGDPA